MINVVFQNCFCFFELYKLFVYYEKMTELISII